MIPKGYKHTELGILPQNWEVVRLGEVADFFSGGTPKTTEGKYYGGEIPFIKSAEIYNSSTQEYLTQLGMNESSAKWVKKGDLLFALYGANSGEVAIAKINGAINQAVLCIKNKLEVLNTYFLYSIFLEKKEWITTRFLQGGQGNLSGKIVKNLQIPLPPFAEQEKIAEILSTWDTQIQNYESLIKEKQTLKKGLCQTLLTAKTRLKGFSEDWEVVKLGDILGYEQPTQYLVSSAEYDNSYLTPVLTAGKTFILGYTNEVEGIYTDLPIILFDDFTTASQYVDFPFKVKSSACKILKLRKVEFNLKIIFEIMQRLNFVADDHKRYWISEYQNQEIFLPNTKEQEKISEILSEADNEIMLLEQKLESLKSQKKGIMQNLLNGKVRVTQ